MSVLRYTGHNSNTGCSLKIFFVPPDAYCFFQLLEYGSWQHTGRSPAGQRRTPDHAHPRQEHGMASSLSGSRKKCRNFKTGSRREGKDKLYSLNLWFFSTSRMKYSPGCVLFFLGKHDFHRKILNVLFHSHGCTNFFCHFSHTL